MYRFLIQNIMKIESIPVQYQLTLSNWWSKISHSFTPWNAKWFERLFSNLSKHSKRKLKKTKSTKSFDEINDWSLGKKLLLVLYCSTDPRKINTKIVHRALLPWIGLRVTEAAKTVFPWSLITNVERNIRVKDDGKNASKTLLWKCKVRTNRKAIILECSTKTS